MHAHVAQLWYMCMRLGAAVCATDAGGAVSAPGVVLDPAVMGWPSAIRTVGVIPCDVGSPSASSREGGVSAGDAVPHQAAYQLHSFAFPV